MNDFDKYMEISQNVSALYTHLRAAMDAYNLVKTPENLEKINEVREQLEATKRERLEIEKRLHKQQ